MHAEHEFKPGQYIALKDLIPGKEYEGRCRNSSRAIWTPEKGGFTYIRHKFEHKYEETLKHPENDDGIDLFYPFRLVPERIKSVKIYCDMDGVLTDFKASMLKTFGYDYEALAAEMGLDWLWSKLNSFQYQDIWRNMGWNNGGQLLWNHLVDTYEHVYICTSPGRDSNTWVKAGKTQWCWRHLDIHYKHTDRVIFAHDKWKHSKTGVILIDDTPKQADNWVTKGKGKAILHTSAIRTIKDLEAMI